MTVANTHHYCMQDVHMKCAQTKNVDINGVQAEGPLFLVNPGAILHNPELTMYCIQRLTTTCPAEYFLCIHNVFVHNTCMNGFIC